MIESTVMTEMLLPDSERALSKAAHILRGGGVIVSPFRGPLALICDADSQSAVNKIIDIKERPLDKKTIMIVPPEGLDQFVDRGRLPHDLGTVKRVWQHVHALGLILPASDQVPEYLVSHAEDGPTVANIYTRYGMLDRLYGHFRALGGRAFSGTSANRAGRPTYTDMMAAMKDFWGDVDAVIIPDEICPPERQRSTTMVDMTLRTPRLHRRDGNVTVAELTQAFACLGLPTIDVDHASAIVKPGQ
jgi:L-threonylcarbamoyladenylate synthase